MSKKAVLYARYSSDKRDESIDSQVKAAEEYAAKHDLIIVYQYIDEAESTTRDTRPAFERMLEDSTNGSYEAVIVHKMDMFSSKASEFAVKTLALMQSRIELISVIADPDYCQMSHFIEAVTDVSLKAAAPKKDDEDFEAALEKLYLCYLAVLCKKEALSMNNDDIKREVEHFQRQFLENPDWMFKLDWLEIDSPFFIKMAQYFVSKCAFSHIDSILLSIVAIIEGQ